MGAAAVGDRDAASRIACSTFAAVRPRWSRNLRLVASGELTTFGCRRKRTACSCSASGCAWAGDAAEVRGAAAALEAAGPPAAVAVAGSAAAVAVAGSTARVILANGASRNPTYVGALSHFLIAEMDASIFKGCRLPRDHA